MGRKRKTEHELRKIIGREEWGGFGGEGMGGKFL